MSNKQIVAEIKTNMEKLTAAHDELFAACLRQIKPATCHTKQEVMQRVIERNNLIEALESYLAAKGG
jgi:hypothetical protein